MQSAADLGRTPSLVNAQVADDIRHLPTAVAVCRKVSSGTVDAAGASLRGDTVEEAYFARAYWIFPRALKASMPALNAVLAQDESPLRRHLKINRR